MYLIKLKAGHPTGSFLRSGIRVTYGKPVVVDSVSEKVKNERWFEIVEITPEKLAKITDFLDLRAKKEMTHPVDAPEAPKTKKKGK